SDEALDLRVESRLLVQLAERVLRWRRADLGHAARQGPTLVVGPLDERDVARLVERGHAAADLGRRDPDVREVRPLGREVRVDGETRERLGDDERSLVAILVVVV